MLALLGAAAAGADECAPWPGEPDPLPTLDDSDPLRARWAELRVFELSERARRREASATIEAYLLWRRVLCLQPGSFEARLGAARTRPIRIHRPGVVRDSGREAPPQPPADDPWIILAAPLAVADAQPDAQARAAARRRILAAIGAELDAGEESLRQARFTAALAAAEMTRLRLDRLRSGDDLRGPRVRLEVLAAIAQIALGDESAARASLARAIAVDPDLALDPRRSPPKLVRALETARGEQDQR